MVLFRIHCIPQYYKVQVCNLIMGKLSSVLALVKVTRPSLTADINYKF